MFVLSDIVATLLSVRDNNDSILKGFNLLCLFASLLLHLLTMDKSIVGFAANCCCLYCSNWTILNLSLKSLSLSLGGVVMVTKLIGPASLFLEEFSSSSSQSEVSPTTSISMSLAVELLVLLQQLEESLLLLLEDCCPEDWAARAAAFLPCCCSHSLRRVAMSTAMPLAASLRCCLSKDLRSFFSLRSLSLRRSSSSGIGSPLQVCGCALCAGRPGPFLVCSFFLHFARRFWNHTCNQIQL